MTLTDNFGLSLFEPTDRVSLAAVNGNTEKLDEAVGIRAKIQTGSWVGETSCAAPESYTVYSSASGTSKQVTASLGAPVSSSRDIVLTLDFEPKLLVISGHMEADVNWSGYLLTSSSDSYAYSSFTHTGKEYLAYQQVICRGQTVSRAEVTARRPAVGAHYYASGNAQYVSWEADADDSACLAEFGTTEDGKYTVTIKGGSSVYGTENYADIEGLTYHWTAFG